MAEIAVEVVYALPERQALLRLSVPAGTSAREAVLLSGIAEAFPGLDVQGCPLGIFGKLLARPEERVLEAGERVEIYRPLIADPKEVRKQRAARARSEREGGEPRGFLRK
ncbi:TPA: RnfH family protein [Pseudomonas aeruginosa]|nr:RnfH family protein [Pseudomonas aeruginosa]